MIDRPESPRPTSAKTRAAPHLHPTSIPPRAERTVNPRQNTNYDYAGQDPINSYDLTGTISCRDIPFIGSVCNKVVKKAKSAVKAVKTVIRQNTVGQINAAEASVVSQRMGGPVAKPQGSGAPGWGQCTASGKTRLAGAAVLLGVGGVVGIGGYALEFGGGVGALSAIVGGSASAGAIAAPSTIAAAGVAMFAAGAALCEPAA